MILSMQISNCSCSEITGSELIQSIVIRAWIRDFVSRQSVCAHCDNITDGEHTTEGLEGRT